MEKHEKETKQCTLCFQVYNLDNFYKKKDGKIHTYCKSCLNTETVNRQRKVKQDAVNYKGGKCQKCGYGKYIGALHFHHIDPDTKDIKWKNFKLRKFNEAFKLELNKCILLCANCHAEIHNR